MTPISGGHHVFAQLIFDNSLDAILLTAPDGSIHAANAAAERLFGWSAAEICAGGRQLLVDTGDPRLPAALEERQRLGRAQAQLFFKRKDGGRIECEVSSALFTTPEGTRSAMIIRDLSPRQLLEQRVRALEQLEATVRLSGALAHALNNPLAALHGNLHLLREQLSEHVEPDVGSMLGDAIASIRDLTELGRDFFRIAGGVNAGAPERLDAVALVEAWAARAGGTRGAAQLTLRPAPGPCWVTGRVGDLERAMDLLTDYFAVRGATEVLVEVGVPQAVISLTAPGVELPPERRRYELLSPHVAAPLELKLDLKVPMAARLVASGGGVLEIAEQGPLGFELRLKRP